MEIVEKGEIEGADDRDLYTYQVITARLAAAGRMIDAGDVAGAEQLIRATKGLRAEDLSAQLSAAQINALSAHALNS